MKPLAISYPRLAFPFTLIVDGEMLHLIAGEDIRYTVQIGPKVSEFRDFLEKCQGNHRIEDLLSGLGSPTRELFLGLIRDLAGERILLDGLGTIGSDSGPSRLVPEGHGPLTKRLELLDSQEAPGGKEIHALCQGDLNYQAALQFNRRCLVQGTDPWLWVTTGPMNRAFVSPLFLPESGPCLNCLIRQFQRLSPAPQLFDALLKHGMEGGTFNPVPFPDHGTRILEQIIIWKRDQWSTGTPSQGVFRLHVLELDSMEITAHRVLWDPTCMECRNARLV